MKDRLLPFLLYRKIRSKLVLPYAFLFLVALSTVAMTVGLAQPQVANATVPKLIYYQGKISKTSDGSNIANGNYSMQFKIYSAASSGSLLWTETWDGASGTTQVAFVNGLFSVALGTWTSLNSIDFTTGSLYLTANFNPGAGYDGEMSPRQQLTSTPFAISANGVNGDGAVNTTVSSATALTVANTGSDYGFQVDTSTSSSATGIKIKSAAATGGAALSVISSGTNENLTIDAKGTGTISLGATSTGNLLLGGATGDVLLAGGSSGTGCTVTNSTGAFACTAGGSFTTLALTGAVTGAASYNGLVVTANTGVVTTGTWNGTAVDVAHGGTGVATLASNGILYGNGTGAVQALAANAGATLCLTQASSAAPVWGSCGAGGATAFDAIGDPAGNGAINMGTTVQTLDWGAVTTTDGLSITSSGTGLTSGSVLKVTSATTGAVTNGIVQMTANGAYTGTGGLLNLTAGTVTGSTLSVTDAATMTTTGKLFSLISNAATTTTGLFTQSATGLTTGFAEAKTLGTALTTGGALNITGASYNPTSGATGSLVNLAFTNAATNAASDSTLTIGISISPTVNAAGATGTQETYGLYVQAAAGTPGAGTQNIYGMRIGNQGLTNAESSYGLYIDQITSTTNQKDIYIAGVSTGTNNMGLHINSVDGSARGIVIGNAFPTNALTGKYIDLGAGSNVTFTSGASPTESGKYLVAARSDVVNNTSGVTALTISGNLADLSSSCTISDAGAGGADTCTDTGKILQLTQSYTAASGDVLNISGAGTGNALAISDTGLTSNSFINISHTSSSYTGTVIKANIANGSGSFASGNFIDLQTNNSSKFTVDFSGAINTGSWNATAIPVTKGGTGSAFFTVSGPTATRTFTFPDASATVLTSNALVTVAQGGIGIGTLASNGILYGNGTGAVQALAVNAGATLCLTQASSAAPAWGSCGGAGGGISLAPSSADATASTNSIENISATGITSNNFLNLKQSSSAFTGTGLFLDFASGSGTFNSGNFLDFRNNAGAATSSANSVFTVTNTGNVVHRTSTNSSTAFQVDNSAGAPIFLVDTTSNDPAGNQVNYLTYPGFETGSFSNAAAGWAATGSTLTQNTNKQHTYFGLYSASVVSTATAQGLHTGSFVSAPPGSISYIVSFYAKISTGTIAGNLFTVTTTGGAGSCSPSASVTINSNGFQRLSCTVAVGAGAVTDLQITQTSGANTIYYDSIQMQKTTYNGNAITLPTAYQIGGVQIRGLITNPMVVQNNSDSVSAFQVNTANGVNLFNIDTLNSKVSVSSTNSTGTATLAAFAMNDNSLTTGTGLYVTSSSITSGKLVDIAIAGTAAAASQTGLNVSLSGANATAGLTTYGMQISNTHTSATSGSNVGLAITMGIHNTVSQNNIGLLMQDSGGLGGNIDMKMLTTYGTNAGETMIFFGTPAEGATPKWGIGRESYCNNLTTSTFHIIEDDSCGSARFIISPGGNTGIGLGDVVPTATLDTASTAAAQNVVKITDNAASYTGTLLTLSGTSMTSGNGLTVTGGTATTGTLIGVTSTSTSAPTAGLVRFNFNGIRTAAGVGFQIDDISTTSATVMQINANSLTSGNGLVISATATGLTGSALSVTTGATGAPSTGLVRFNFNGIRTGGGTAFRIDDVSTTNATTMTLNANSLTTGFGVLNNFNAMTTGNGFSIVSTSTGITAATATNSGSLFDVTAAGAMTGFTGSLASIHADGANTVGSTGTALNINIGGTAQVMQGLKITTASTAATVTMMTMAYSGNPTAATTQRYIAFTANAGTLQGQITRSATTGNVLYTATSDARIKHDITDTHFSLSDLMGLKIRDYKMNDDPKNTTLTGFVAQELNAVYPEAVATNGDNGLTPLGSKDTPWSVDYGKITPLLAKAIQDQQNLLGGFTTKNMPGLSTLAADLSNETPHDPAAIMAANITAGKPFLTDFFAVRVTAVRGYFTDAFAQNLTAGLQISSVSVKTKGLTVNTITSDADMIKLMSDTTFIGRPYFNADTAGFAKISEGDNVVTVHFESPYLEQPIVNIGLAQNADPKFKTETDQDKINEMKDAQVQFAKDLFGANIQYAVINKNENEFTIILNKPAPKDLTFSWIALAVKSAKISLSNHADSVDMGTVAGDSTVNSSDSSSSSEDQTPPADESGVSSDDLTNDASAPENPPVDQTPPDAPTENP